MLELRSGRMDRVGQKSRANKMPQTFPQIGSTSKKDPLRFPSAWTRKGISNTPPHPKDQALYLQTPNLQFYQRLEAAFGVEHSWTRAQQGNASQPSRLGKEESHAHKQAAFQTGHTLLQGQKAGPPKWRDTIPKNRFQTTRHPANAIQQTQGGGHWERFTDTQTSMLPGKIQGAQSAFKI